MRRALLPFIFVLILTFHTLNIQWYTGIENTKFVAADPSDSVIGRGVSHNKSGEIYRDGIVDNFDNFTNPGFPAEHEEFCIFDGSYRII